MPLSLDKNGIAGIVNFSITGNQTIGNTLSVTGVSTLNTTALGATSVTGNLTVSANTTTSNLTVSSNTTTGNLTVSSRLNYGGVLLTNAVTGTGKMVLDTTPTIATPVLTNPTVTDYIETPQSVGTVGSTSTLSLTNGTILTATLTASTPCTFTMPTATAGKSFVLYLTQAATGMTTAIFTGVKWPAGVAPTITATASAVDIISFISVASTWHGNAAQAYA